MLAFTRQWVINIVALVLFIIMFEMLLPTGKMKKYINLVTGTILIIAIISPLTGLLGRNADISAFQVSNSNQLDKLEVEKDSKILKKEQMKQIVDVYRDKIIEQLEQNAKEVKGVKQAHADVIFNEDYNSKNFGEIKRAYIEIVPETESPAGKKDKGDSSPTTRDSSPQDTVTVESEDGDNSIKPVERIKKIDIGEETSTSVITDNSDPSVKKKLEDRISDIFGISSDNIIISKINSLQK